MDINNIEKELQNISDRIVEFLIEGLKNEKLRVEVDYYVAKVVLGNLVFNFWVANGITSLECYESEKNSVDLFLSDSQKLKLWESLIPYIDKQRNNKYIFESKNYEK
ncbi:MAG: hypothetical protein KatS3mg101_1015 [Patescibacteria group bacterium]|nr:MAG: hypothetical protein KatS3mg101_1015 [Patescibacteria group bacterium]